jgi:hypothetical protein
MTITVFRFIPGKTNRQIRFEESAVKDINGFQMR